MALSGQQITAVMPYGVPGRRRGQAVILLVSLIGQGPLTTSIDASGLIVAMVESLLSSSIQISISLAALIASMVQVELMSIYDTTTLADSENSTELNPDGPTTTEFVDV